MKGFFQEQKWKWTNRLWRYYAGLRLSMARTVRQKTIFPVEVVVFSKDRALQLHGLLRSFFANTTPRVPVHVLYACSSPEHEKAYTDIKAIFRDAGVAFLRQQSTVSFREDLLTLLDSLQSDRIFFLVDDIIFIEKVNFTRFYSFDPGHYVPSLRMGLNLKRCYPLQQEQPLPPLLNDEAAGADTICWKWEDGIFDWNYPLSVDGHLFSAGEIRTMFRMIDFCAPNSLESGMQRFRPLFLSRLGIGYRKSRIVNIPCNKVQLENSNICGNLHQNELLVQWQQGLQINIQRLQGFVSESVHQDIVLPLVPRED